MKKGIVKWYNNIKGFGFIRSNDGKDVFVYHSGLVSPYTGLETNQEVVFDQKTGDRGEVAYNVK